MLSSFRLTRLAPHYLTLTAYSITLCEVPQTCFLVEQDPQVLVLRTAEGQTVSLDQSEIAEISPQKKSLMPEAQLKTLSDEQVRNLFAYLRSGQPLAN